MRTLTPVNSPFLTSSAPDKHRRQHDDSVRMTLAPSELPESLWADDALRVPPALLSEHLADLAREGLLEAATSGPGAIGGASAEEFRHHYATMFRAGACRVCAVLLDPAARLAPIPGDLQASLTAGSLCLLDAPSGACTASLGILAALLELRLRRVLPQLPQTIHIFAADISPDSLRKGAALLAQLRPALSSVGITVNVHTRSWDATSPNDTAQLSQWVLTTVPRVGEYLVICESFSGATSAEKAEAAADRFPHFSGSVAHLVSAFAEDRTTFLWIEPRTKGAKHLLGFVGDLLHSLLRQRRSDKHDHEYRWFDSLLSTTHRCNVHVLRYRRGG